MSAMIWLRARVPEPFHRYRIQISVGVDCWPDAAAEGGTRLRQPTTALFGDRDDQVCPRSSHTTLAEDISLVTVQARVSDWQDRSDDLYRQLKDWSPADYRLDTSQHLSMHEELMKYYGVAPVELSVLNIYDNSVWEAKIVPYGLWIIGGDGRLDLLTAERRYLITGVPPTAGSGWRISEPGARGHVNPLNQSSWLAALQ
ncbi:hypothetical protein MKK75_05330 [Methylobacterium sp. J-030]|uniref:hypothetical protein n=1 Tax=Methylobacterium sp. J-030 TaxID=2836627 RepID=UPI001FBBE633|nr:hypothetical protein [Methylobacterium sp. J-030]MCJ2068237.1 hypothetical protein [Methylobacterium sp. J-030]